MVFLQLPFEMELVVIDTTRLMVVILVSLFFVLILKLNLYLEIQCLLSQLHDLRLDPAEFATAGKPRLTMGLESVKQVLNWSIYKGDIRLHRMGFIG